MKILKPRLRNDKSIFCPSNWYFPYAHWSKKSKKKNSKDIVSMGDPKDFMIILPISRRRTTEIGMLHFFSFFIFALTSNFDTKNFYKSYFGCSSLWTFSNKCLLGIYSNFLFVIPRRRGIKTNFPNGFQYYLQSFIQNQQFSFRQIFARSIRAGSKGISRFYLRIR